MFLTLGEVAELIGMSRTTVRRYCDLGMLRYVRPSGPSGHRRIAKSELERFLSSCASGDAADCAGDDLQSVLAIAKNMTADA